MKLLRLLLRFGWLRLLGSFRRKRPAWKKETQRGQKLQRASDVPLEVIATISLDGVFKTANPACKTILGYEPEELVGRNYMDLVHPDDHDRSAMLTTAIADGVAEVRLENRVRRKDGSIAQIEWSAAALPEGGTVYCLARDVTDRKRAKGEIQQPDETLETRLMERIRQLEAAIAELKHNEQALRESEKLFRSLVEHNISDIITVLEADGTVRVHESPALERVLGHLPGERTGTSAFKWIHPGDVKRALSLFAEILDKPGIHRPIEFRVPHPDGSWRYLEHTVNNLLDDPDVRGIVVSSRDITERKVLEEQLRHQAFHDSLTDLPNRALFMDRLEHALVLTSRRKRSIAVLFLDLNNFKLINDSLGHETGDQLLIAVAERLKACLRPEDTVARFGGDEFTILLEDIADESDAIHTAAQIAEELKTPFVLEEREVFTTPSIGIALGTSGKDRPEDLLRQADIAMYQAKNKGEAYYLAADLSMSSRALKRLELENDLRRAIEREEFRVYYQPIVLLENGRTVGMEALVRWEHPERGLLLPFEFVPTAEETGLIVPIEKWVLEVACRQVRAWQEQCPSYPRLMVSVNLYAERFRQPNLVDEVAEALQKTGLHPSSLSLEITESAVMEDEPSPIILLQELAALGVQLAIDDFGTGYSSMSYLKRFPVKFLKIDRSFVEGLEEDPEGRAILSAMIGLAQALNMEAIAEGVENDKQLAQLREMGCEMAQGNYFSEPLSAEAASALLAPDLQ
jgi:diguanylate cyclase (GGDEF)-like protein/PAS domain S-box-containing protein